ncbi:MAG: O-antigen ligase family protein [Calothrix sp. C42_A2020_038]|nr:O-antigen ligase family protein [Calothrix sp. C42_A2020_038]
MKAQLIGQLWRKLEPGIVILLLLIFPADVDLAPPIRSAVNVFAYIIIYPLILGCWKRFIYVCTKDWTLLLLLIIALASTSWSVAPEVSNLKLRALIRTMMIGAYLVARYTPVELTQLLSKVFILSGFLSYAAILLIPSYGLKASNVEGDLGWAGIYVFKNGLGSIMTLAATLALLNFLSGNKKRFLSLIGFALAVILIIFSKSSTSVVSLVSAIALVPLFKIVRQHYKQRVVLGIAALIVAIGIGILSVSNLNVIFSDILGKESNLTGRQPLWEAIISVAEERPWLGYGFGGAFWNSAFGVEAARRNPLGWPPVDADLTNFHSHNGYIELFTQLGWLGCSIFIINSIFILYRVISLIMTTKKMENFWMLQILTIIFIFNYSEVPTLLAANQLTWVLYVSISLSSAVQKTRIKRERYLNGTLNLTV